MNKVAINTALSAAIMVAVTACAPVAPPNASEFSPTPSVSPTPPLSVELGLLTHGYKSSPEGVGMTALLEGPLTLDNGCIGVGAISLAFRRGATSWDGETLTFLNATYRLGDTISVGGGGIPLDSAYTEIIEECGSEAFFVSG